MQRWFVGALDAQETNRAYAVDDEHVAGTFVTRCARAAAGTNAMTNAAIIVRRIPTFLGYSKRVGWWRLRPAPAQGRASSPAHTDY